MADEHMFGLIKFFRDPTKLEALINGLFYCNTPEFYRLSGDEGVSDLHESCSYAYRKERGDEPIKLEIDGHEIGGITALTRHRPGFRDHWLHCWFKMSIPKDNNDYETLADDINKMRQEFGVEYAFILSTRLDELLRRLHSATDREIIHGPVSYSNDRNDWSAACKPNKYSYQREYRFLIGECNHTSIEELKIQYDGGFSDLISRSQEIELQNKESGHVLFKLNPEGCLCLPSL